MTLAQLGSIMPEIVLLVAGLLAVVAGLVLDGGDRGPETSDRAGLVATAIGIAGSLIAMVLALTLIGAGRTPTSILSGAFVLDHFAVFFQVLLLIFAAITLLLGHRYAERFRPHQPEFVGLVLLATLGGMFMASAREMIELYVALETLSISLYVLVAFNKRERLSSEAGFKYLVVGAASSAVLLYGLAILYGLTGRTDLDAVATIVASGRANSPALVLATLLVVGGLSFKIAAVPFHQWVPDVYQGAPTPVTAFISVSSKAAGWALMVRVLTSALLPMTHQWGIYLAIVAAITMTVGNVTALSQTSLKRLLGYSSIAHAGYIMMGLLAITAGSRSLAAVGVGAVLFYLLAYGLTNLAAFAAVEAAEDGLGTDDIGALVGISRRSGGLALALALSLLSLTGIPPLVGFFAKFFVFLAAVQAGYAWLAMIALANSALSAVYYLRVVRAMYQDEGRAGAQLRVGTALWTALGIGLLAVLPLSAFASPVVDLARQGASAVFLR